MMTCLLESMEVIFRRQPLTSCQKIHWLYSYPEKKIGQHLEKNWRISLIGTDMIGCIFLF